MSRENGPHNVHIVGRVSRGAFPNARRGGRRGRSAGCAFTHETLFHHGDAGFLTATVPFLREALGAAEPVMVAVSSQRISMLRRALGADANRIRFTDMRSLGGNPARIIPAWQDFLDTHAGAHSLRGVGEPVWAGRDTEELQECQLHEALLNTAFDGGRRWRLLCPYDIDALDREVVETARRSHPFIHEPHGSVPCARYCDEADGFGGTLAPAPERAARLDFDLDELSAVRGTVLQVAEASRLDEERTQDLVLAVNELATNSISHGGGSGRLEAWVDGDGVVCQVSDRGYIVEPLAGRVRPTGAQLCGRGLWLVHQLCDLVQIRSGPGATTVRARMRPRCGPSPA